MYLIWNFYNINRNCNDIAIYDFFHDFSIRLKNYKVQIIIINNVDKNTLYNDFIELTVMAVLLTYIVFFFNTIKIVFKIVCKLIIN